MYVTRISRYITLYIAFGIIRGFKLKAVSLGTYYPLIRGSPVYIYIYIYIYTLVHEADVENSRIASLYAVNHLTL